MLIFKHHLYLVSLILIIIFYRLNVRKDDVSHILWAMVGSPAEIGFYSKNTRELETLYSGKITFDIPSSQPTFEVELSLQNLLPINKQIYLPSSMVMMTFKYPSICDEPNLEIKELNGKIIEI